MSTHPDWQVSSQRMDAFRERMAKRCEESGIDPIPAICAGKHKHEWLDTNGNGAIRAPSLKNCVCFWCGAQLVPHPGYSLKQSSFLGVIE